MHNTKSSRKLKQVPDWYDYPMLTFVRAYLIMMRKFCMLSRSENIVLSKMFKPLAYFSCMLMEEYIDSNSKYGVMLVHKRRMEKNKF